MHVAGKKIGKWTVVKRLGKGSFGELWLGEEDGSKIKVAIKFEKMDSDTSADDMEYQRYVELGVSEYVPRIYKFMRIDQTDYHALVMELLSKTLENMLDICDRKFSLKTTLQLAINMITLLQFVHSKGLIHRDIKPDNFMFGRKENGKDKKLMIIDFGLAKRYIENGKHIKYATGKSLTGTCRYMSINCHKGIQQSRRDDLESIGYIFVYFLNGKLPWSGINASSTQRNKFVCEKKESIPPEQLIEGHPIEFAQYLRIVRGYKFAHNPDYDALRQLFVGCAASNNVTLDGTYDWDGKLGANDSEGEIKPQTESNRKQRSGGKALI